MFFKPTLLYKEFLILDLIFKHPNITQRYISDSLNISVSMVNLYISEYEGAGYINRKYISSKTIQYILSDKGIERMKFLNISYLHSSQEIYIGARENIVAFLQHIIDDGVTRLLLYGAGEVAEILLQVINGDKELPLSAVAVIDDNPDKEGKIIHNTPIVGFAQISVITHEAILISSYSNNRQIKSKFLTFAG